MQPNTLQQVCRRFLRWFGNFSIQSTSINAYKQFSYNVIYLESESILVGRSACKAQQELWIALDLRSSSTSNHFEYLLPQPKQTFKFGIPYFKVFLTICPDQLMNSSFSSIFVFFPRFCFANIFIAMRSVQRLDSNSALNFMAVCSSATSKTENPKII